jgi:hypothetical protein
MKEVIVKVWLSLLLTAPFAALVSDALGRTEGLMLRVGGGVVGILIFGMLFYRFQERPNFATFVNIAFWAWPIFLLIAKAIRPSISWATIWFSIPLMSWFCVTLLTLITNGHPFGGIIAIFLGWIPMIIPFGILSAIFVGIQRFVRKIRSNKKVATAHLR